MHYCDRHLDFFFLQYLVGTTTPCPQLFFLHCSQRCAATSSCSLPLSVCIDWNVCPTSSSCVTATGTRISAIGESLSWLTETCKWPFIFYQKKVPIAITLTWPTRTGRQGMFRIPSIRDVCLMGLQKWMAPTVFVCLFTLFTTG